MHKLLLLITFFFLAETKAQSQELLRSGIKLYTIEGKKKVMNDFEKICVVIFLSPGCPLSQKYTLTLNELSKEFNGKAEFYGIFSESDPVLKDYKDFEKRYKISFKLFSDKDKELAKALSASVTPESFVLNKGKVLYHGAIDDWAIALGKTKKTATINFVRNAIQSAIANKTPAPDYVKPVGCFIE